MRVFNPQLVKRDVNYAVYAPQVTAAPTVVDVLHRVNIARMAHGLLPLARHDGLATSAQVWAEHLRDTNTFEHGAWAERISEHYAHWRTIGENIAGGYTTAQDAVAAWMASEGHRANILNADFEEAGVGYAEGGYYGKYYVMDYGARFKS